MRQSVPEASRVGKPWHVCDAYHSTRIGFEGNLARYPVHVSALARSLASRWLSRSHSCRVALPFPSADRSSAFAVEHVAHAQSRIVHTLGETERSLEETAGRPTILRLCHAFSKS